MSLKNKSGADLVGLADLLDGVANHLLRRGITDGSAAKLATISNELRVLAGAEVGGDAARLDYIERTFSGCSNQERYLPLRMIWGKGAMGRTLREACDKYMKRDAERTPPPGSGRGGENENG